MVADRPGRRQKVRGGGGGEKIDEHNEDFNRLYNHRKGRRFVECGACFSVGPRLTIGPSRKK